jgi:hypothetical protein
MSGCMVSDHRPKPKDLAKISDQERAERFNTVVAYGGTFEVVGNQVVHTVDISWNETWTGTTQRRDFRIDGSRLTIDVGPQIGVDGRRSTAVLIWTKVNRHGKPGTGRGITAHPWRYSHLARPADQED